MKGVWCKMLDTECALGQLGSEACELRWKVVMTTDECQVPLYCLLVWEERAE